MYLKIAKRKIHMKTKKLQVGFDLDGVILYNPARIVRPFISGFKRRVLKKTKTRFYVPRTRPEELLWLLLHQSSLFIAPGFEDIRQMVTDGKIDAYLITARFACLKPDLDRWLRRLKATQLFKEIYYNRENLQPHHYKEATIKSLDLDYFIDDNWDIVRSLNDAYVKKEMPTKVYWLYNIADKQIDYSRKVDSLQKFTTHLKSQLPASKK
jgi:hypothetical protein